MVLDDSWREHTVKYGHAGVRPVHVVAFGLAIVNFLLNGLIWYAFHACSKIINKSHLYLFYAMAVTNCLTGFFSMPTFINLFAHDNINCPKWTIIVGSAFEMALDRMRAILALAIACDRLFAIFRPRTFFLSDHKKNALKVCAFGAIWSIGDALFMVFEDGLSQIRTHCVSTSSSGPLFHTYFLILSLIDGFGLFFVYVVFLIKFLSIRKSMPEPPSASPNVDAKQPLSVKRRGMKDLVAQANSLTLTVIFCVLVFSVLPSMLYGYDMLMHRVVFMDLGPVVTIGYHLHGITSSFCYNYKHREIRRALDKVYPIRKRVCMQTTSSSTEKKSSDRNNLDYNARPSLTPHRSNNNNNDSLRAPELRSSPPTGTGTTTSAPDIVVTDALLVSAEDVML